MSRALRHDHAGLLALLRRLVEWHGLEAVLACVVLLIAEQQAEGRR